MLFDKKYETVVLKYCVLIYNTVNRLRVLFISFFNPFTTEGGVAAHTRGLCQALAKIGCEVYILILIPNNRLHNQLRNINEIRIFQKKYINHFLSRIPSINANILPLISSGDVIKLCKQYGIDIIHGQSPSSWGYSMFRENKIPFLVTLHSTSFGELKSYINIPFSNINLRTTVEVINEVVSALSTSIEYKRANKIIAVSKALAEEAIKYFHLSTERIVVIHNGIDLQGLNVYYKKRKEDQTILSVGRLVWRKGFKFLIDAMPNVLSEYPDARLFIVGDGDQQVPLQRLVKKLGIDHAVKFLGRVSTEKLYSLYCKADVYVQPSLYEPCGITILEAMSFGKPIVATNVGGTPELITNGVEGLLVKPKDSEHLAKAITCLFSDSSLKKKLGDNARRRVERDFTWEVVAKKTMKLYIDLLTYK